MSAFYGDGQLRAHDIISGLIGAVVTALRPTFRLAKLEGDAALAFAPAGALDAAAVTAALAATALVATFLIAASPSQSLTPALSRGLAALGVEAELSGAIGEKTARSWISHGWWTIASGSSSPTAGWLGASPPTGHRRSTGCA